MFHISIISGSVRINRQSHKVALFFERYIKKNNLAEVEILDLKAYNFPLLEERLMYNKNAGPDQKEFSDKIKKSDAVILISPEYNGGYPAAVKNAIDMLVKEWYHKPIGIVTVSSGGFGGVNAMALLQTVLLKIKAVPVTGTFPVTNIDTSFDDDGVPLEKDKTEKRAKAFMDEVLWFAEAFSNMKD